MDIKRFANFNDNDDEQHIIILVPQELKIESIDLLNEGIWKDSAEKGIRVRVDAPHIPSGKRHVHVARKEHQNSKDMQASWNDDGSKHDKKSFNNNFTGLERAKNAARQALGLDDSVILERYSGNDIEEILKKHGLTIDSDFVIFDVEKLSGKQLLFS